MYSMELCDILTGKTEWYNECYINSYKKTGKIIYWAPRGEQKRKYKILSWKFDGYEDMSKSQRSLEINEYVTTLLLGLDIPQMWREELDRVDYNAVRLEQLRAENS